MKKDTSAKRNRTRFVQELNELVSIQLMMNRHSEDEAQSAAEKITDDIVRCFSGLLVYFPKDRAGITESKKAMICDDYSNGYSINEIAVRNSVSFTYVYLCIRDMKKKKSDECCCQCHSGIYDDPVMPPLPDYPLTEEQKAKCPVL